MTVFRGSDIGVAGSGGRDPAALAYPLDEEWLKPGGLKVLHVVSRWQLGTAGLSSDPLSPWCGEPAAAGHAPLTLHPSRVVRFLGTPCTTPGPLRAPGRIRCCRPSTTPSTRRR